MTRTPLPVIEIGGYSGSGKTTLLLELVARLPRAGLRPLVVKHDAHGLKVDRANSDTARLFAAGADVAALDPAQSFLRSHRGDDVEWETLLAQAASAYDLVLVEGFKRLEVPCKIWLRRHARDRAPPGLGFRLDLGRNDDRPAAAMARINRWLRQWHRAAPVYGAILVGGQSRRMGRPKHQLGFRGTTWLSRAEAALRPHVLEVVLLGCPERAGRLGLRRLPDVPDREGPMAGLMAALRWQPAARWIVTACDMPLLDADGIGWLAGQTGPGYLAVMGRSVEGAPPDPFPGIFEGRLATRLAQAKGPIGIAQLARTATPAVPPKLRAMWRNFNSPGDCQALAAVAADGR